MHGWATCRIGATSSRRLQNNHTSVLLSTQFLCSVNQQKCFRLTHGKQFGKIGGQCYIIFSLTPLRPSVSTSHLLLSSSKKHWITGHSILKGINVVNVNATIDTAGMTATYKVFIPIRVVLYGATCPAILCLWVAPYSIKFHALQYFFFLYSVTVVLTTIDFIDFQSIKVICIFLLLPLLVGLDSFHHHRSLWAFVSVPVYCRFWTAKV